MTTFFLLSSSSSSPQLCLYSSSFMPCAPSACPFFARLLCAGSANRRSQPRKRRNRSYSITMLPFGDETLSKWGYSLALLHTHSAKRQTTYITREKERQRSRVYNFRFNSCLAMAIAELWVYKKYTHFCAVIGLFYYGYLQRALGRSLSLLLSAHRQCLHHMIGAECLWVGSLAFARGFPHTQPSGSSVPLAQCVRAVRQIEKTPRPPYAGESQWKAYDPKWIRTRDAGIHNARRCCHTDKQKQIVAKPAGSFAQYEMRCTCIAAFVRSMIPYSQL